MRLSRRKLTGGEIVYGPPHRITISAHLSAAEQRRHAAARGRARLGVAARRAARRARPALPPARAAARRARRPAPRRRAALAEFRAHAPAIVYRCEGCGHDSAGSGRSAARASASPAIGPGRPARLRRVASRRVRERAVRRATASATRGPRGRTGCTVILPPAGTIAAVDVRGGAPGTRETGVFTPGNLISEIHALVFAGGSAFGLAAASGVTSWLQRAGRRLAVGPARVPIVAAAVLFDLAVGDPKAFPDEAMGRRACDAARRRPARGRVGAGTGRPPGSSSAPPRRPAAGSARRRSAFRTAGGRRRARGRQRVRRRRRPRHRRAARRSRARPSGDPNGRARAPRGGADRLARWPAPTRPWSASRPPCRSIRAA